MLFLLLRAAPPPPTYFTKLLLIMSSHLLHCSLSRRQLPSPVYILSSTPTLHHSLIRSLLPNPAPSMSTSEAAPSATAITIDDSDASGKAPAAAPAPAAPPPAAAAAPPKDRRFPFLLRKTKAGGGGCKRGVACFDFLLRLCAIAATLVAAILMGTTDETLPFFTQFFQFHANFADLPALTFFVVGNAIAAGYLVLSLPFSLAAMVRPQAIGPRLLLFVLDTVMMELTIAAASSATAIVYLAHNGSSKANWVAICLRFDGFCQSISGAVVASFIAVVFFMVLVVMSALVMRKH